MEFNESIEIIKTAYPNNAHKILSSLSPEAICTLASLYKNENVTRQMSDCTINKIATMEPHQQEGYITNPFLQYLIESYLASVMSVKQSHTIQTQTVHPVKIIEPMPVVKPVEIKPPEPEDDFVLDIFA